MTRIISPLARVTIGNDTFVSGDGILKSASVDLGEDARSSRCSISLHDPGLLIGAKYQAMSFTQGGIITPEGLLKAKESSPPASAPVAPSSDPSGTTTSGTSTQNATLKPEVRAFLDLIAWAEGADYTTIYGGRKFSSFADHPRRRITAGGNTSDAAGRYQFLASTWDETRRKIGLKDFSPASQDLAAVYLIDKKRHALKYVEQGTKGLKQAFDLLSYEWASFPPQRYPNQHLRSFTDLTNKYISFLLKYQRQTPAQAVAATQPQVKDKAIAAEKEKPTTIKDKAETKSQEVSQKGTEIIVELGFSLDQLVAYHFFHIGTTTSRSQLDETVFEGAMIRWLLTRRIQNTAYSNITLRQLAQKVCDRYRLKLAMEGSGPLYQHLDQTGISDYELLLREARAIGYSIREDKNVLILQPYRPNFTGFVITQDILQTIRFSDRASTDRSPTPGNTVSTPSTPAAEAKAKHDRKTGQVVQTKAEDSTGTGAKTEAKAAVTGAATPAVHGTTILDTSVTGLPKQEIGAIDLGDGRAEAQLIQDEAKRVKGYESTCSLITTPEVLILAPGSIIGIANEVVPSPFNREWRVGSVRHSLSLSGMRSELSFYSPQAAKTESSAATTSPSSDTTSTNTAAPQIQSKPGGFILPMKGVTGQGLGRRGPNRLHHGTDIAAPSGTPVVASADGVATVASNPGGYGTYVIVRHANDILTIYGHLSRVSVQTGQQVKQGQEIGKCGSTGRSTGPHLHWEIRQGGFKGKALAPSEVGVKIPPDHRAGFRY